MTSLMIKQKQEEIIVTLLEEMKATAARMRTLIVDMSPEKLLGYIYAQHMLKTVPGQGKVDTDQASHLPNNKIDERQFLLEYVHAVLASDVPPAEVKFNEAQCTELFELSRKLKEQAMSFAVVSSINTKNRAFGSDTVNIELQAKSTWVLLRGNRYQVLEGEFYRYVLAPHDDILKEIYGVGAIDIAAGFQDMTNAVRSGQAEAAEEIMKQLAAAQAFAASQKKTLEDAMEEWGIANPNQLKTTMQAWDDLLLGGITNVSRHTKLPPKLLADLAYQRGEEKEFFAEGDFAGTPYRTLPVRKKPLIQFDSDYYAVDPCFARDTGYRALLFSLLQRKPDYKKSFEARQKAMSESAFFDILGAQLSGATVHQEVYYKDSVTKEWCENDTLILIDDVLFLVEAKAGAAATIASPALDFKRHVQSFGT